jgi:hypothetical protein
MNKRLIVVAAVVLLMGLTAGCIRSRVIITSDPPGADVTFKREYRGRTPITIPINWYWFYDVEIEKEGYNKVETMERFHSPVWFYMPFDMVMEAMPFPIKDTKYRHYVLTPKEEL